MRENRKIQVNFVVFALILAGLLYGVYELLVLRFRVGDVYPPYSSLRTDPLGTKALYDGFADQRGLQVEHFFKTWDKIERAPDTALFDLGEHALDVFDAPAGDCKDVERFLTGGGRLVLSLVGEQNDTGGISSVIPRSPLGAGPHPASTPSPTPTETDTPTAVASGGAHALPASGPSKTPTPTPPPVKPPSEVGSLAPPGFTLRASIGKVWGLQVGFQGLPKTTEEGEMNDTVLYQPVTVFLEKGAGEGSPEMEHLPPKLLWHSGYYFQELDPAWKVVYRRGDHPVVIERSWGKGVLVLFSDSYVVSNEAMEADRQAGFLAYLPGDRHRLLFDETHLGVMEEDNLASLMAQYGLGGLLLGLALLALLFIWRNMSSLAPPPPRESGVEAGERSGKDFSSGLVNLLRRNIPPGEILSVCLGLWKKDLPPGRDRRSPKVGEMEREMDSIRSHPGRLPPGEGYARLSRVLKKRR